MAAAAIFIGRTWDYINDPLIGYLSDRTRTRWGRRRPFLLFGFLPFALSFIALWWKPPIGNQVLLAAYYAGAYFMYDLCATLVYMPYFALTPELTLDYDERTSLTSYRMFFSIAGSLIAFTLPLMMVRKFTYENASRVLLMGLTFGLVSAVGMLITFAGTKERPEYQEQTQPNLLDSLRAAGANPPFVFSMAVYLLTWVAVSMVEAPKAMYQARGGRGFSTIPQILSVTDVRSWPPRISGVCRVGSLTVLSTSAKASALMPAPLD